METIDKNGDRIINVDPYRGRNPYQMEPGFDLKTSPFRQVLLVGLITGLASTLICLIMILCMG